MDHGTDWPGKHCGRGQLFSAKADLHATRGTASLLEVSARLPGRAGRNDSPDSRRSRLRRITYLASDDLVRFGDRVGNIRNHLLFRGAADYDEYRRRSAAH